MVSRWCQDMRIPERSQHGQRPLDLFSWGGMADNGLSQRTAVAWLVFLEVRSCQTPLNKKKWVSDESMMINSNSHLVNHIPIEAIEHTLAMMVLFTKLRPQLSSNSRINRPRTLAYQDFHFALLPLLNQTFDVVKCLERLFFCCEIKRRVKLRAGCMMSANGTAERLNNKIKFANKRDQRTRV